MSTFKCGWRSFSLLKLGTVKESQGQEWPLLNSCCCCSWDSSTVPTLIFFQGELSKFSAWHELTSNSELFHQVLWGWNMFQFYSRLIQSTYAAGATWERLWKDRLAFHLRSLESCASSMSSSFSCRLLGIPYTSRWCYLYERSETTTRFTVAKREASRNEASIRRAHRLASGTICLFVTWKIIIGLSFFGSLAEITFSIL